MDIHKVRKTSFRKFFELDSNLESIIKGNPHYAYLSNPPISNIYQYLTDYTALASEQLLGKNRADLSVLDWGTGKGNVTYLLKRFGFGNVVSCDIESSRDTFDENALIIKSLNLNIVPLRHESNLPFDDNSFDVVVSYGVLEHVPNDLASLKEIKRILKPNGLFFCFHLPRKLGYVHRIAHMLGDRYHSRLYDRKYSRTLLDKSGFQLLDIWERTILPKNRFNFKSANATMEKVDHALVNFTPLRLISTNIEFVAQKAGH